MSVKIGIVVNQLAPYRDYVIKLLEREFENIEVWSIHRGGVNHKEWNYKSPLSDVNYLDKKRGSLWSYKSIKTLAKKYDLLIINGYVPFTLLALIFIRKLYRRPYIMLVDTVMLGRAVKLKKIIFDGAMAVIVPGKASKTYLTELGINSEIFLGAYTLDYQKVHEEIVLYKAKATQIRNAIGINRESFVFLFVGKLLKRRRISVLLSAFAKTGHKAELLIIGDGDEEEVVKKSLNGNRIHWIPFANFNDIHKYYAIADAYIHPGEEPYSLALVEAAVGELPIISSYMVGAACDILFDGENGIVIQLDEEEQLIKAMDAVAAGKFSKKKCEEISQFLIKKRSIEWAASEFKKAIAVATRQTG